jgi:predicted permease
MCLGLYLTIRLIYGTCKFQSNLYRLLLLTRKYSFFGPIVHRMSITREIRFLFIFIFYFLSVVARLKNQGSRH